MTLADQLTVARAASVVLVVGLFEWDFENHLYWATAVFMATRLRQGEREFRR